MLVGRNEAAFDGYNSFGDVLNCVFLVLLKFFSCYLNVQRLEVLLSEVLHFLIQASSRLAKRHLRGPMRPLEPVSSPRLLNQLQARAGQHVGKTLGVLFLFQTRCKYFPAQPQSCLQNSRARILVQVSFEDKAELRGALQQVV